MRINGVVFGFLLLSICGAWAHADLIHEVEVLRNSLAPTDPARQTLTLRIADLEFDRIAKERGAADESTPEAQERIGVLQRQGIATYNEALSGKKGLFKPIAGQLRLKVLFQLARLYTDSKQLVPAVALWKELVSQDDLLELRREAAIRLAEIQDEKKEFAQSEIYFRKAISLCDGTDLCSYAYYRCAWVVKYQGRREEALSLMRLALWDSKGQLREEAVRDLIAMLGNSQTDGRSEMTEVDALSAKIGRPSLLSDLSDAFFAIGNRQAGTLVLAFVENRKPSIKSKVRLLEEYYGLRDWDSFHSTFEELKTQTGRPGGKEAVSADPESEKILKRLTVQLDGERGMHPELAREFKSAVELHLALFPEYPDTLRMMKGWLAAEPDLNAKAAAIQAWLKDPIYKLGAPEIFELHSARAGVGIKKKDDAIIAEETGLLANLTQDPAQRREYRFDHLRALYGLGRTDECVEEARALAVLEPGKKPDVWAVRSQNLLIQIYAQRKQYDQVIAEARHWTENTGILAAAATDSELKKSVDGMSGVAEQAQFEYAVGLGDRPEALKTFLAYCREGRIAQKSCANAKVLAVKLGDEAALLAVLKIADNHDELAAEYEAAGYFAEAAALGEQRLVSSSGTRDFLKIALLYELGSQSAKRDEILGRLTLRLQGQKSLGEFGDLLFTTFDEAGLLNKALLSLEWSARTKGRLAEQLEERGQGNALTHAILLSSLLSTGPKWDTLVLSESGRLDQEQRKVIFYGIRSQKLFKVRLAALQRWTGFSEKYLPGANSDVRSRILTALSAAYVGLADEILKTPIPSSVQADQLKSVQEELAKMAAPFTQKSQAYAELLRKNQESDQVALSQSAAVAPILSAASTGQAIESLHRNPSDQEALASLRDSYLTKGSDRLAAYFKGRILKLREKGKS